MPDVTASGNFANRISPVQALRDSVRLSRTNCVEKMRTRTKKGKEVC